MVKGMGGAMDPVAGAQNIIVVMTHASKTANPNCCRSAPCRSPAWAVFAGYSPIWPCWRLSTARLSCAKWPGVSPDEVIRKTAGRLIVADDVREMRFS